MKNIFSWGNSSLIKNHILLKNPLSLPQNQILISIWSQTNRKAEIRQKRKCDVGASKNAGQAFSTKRLSSHFFLSNFCFSFLQSLKLVFNPPFSLIVDLEQSEKRNNTISQMRLRSVFKMRMSILNTATTEQMGQGLISFFVYIKSTNFYFYFTKLWF